MKRILIVLALALGTTGALAVERPFQASLTPDVALYSRNDQINGLTLSVWGENPQTSLALGLVNGSTGHSAGVSLALLLNYADSYTGLQWGLINYTKGDLLGWQGGFMFGIALSVMNYTGGTMKGLQTGVVNYAGKLTGLQLGLLNYAAAADTGVQIGLINLMPENRCFTALPDELAPGMVFVNWHF